MARLDRVLTWRGGVIENSHTIHAAVTDSSGRLLYTVGDASRSTLARSAAKPFQALAILETGAVERFNFDSGDVALMCSSHNAEERHISRARAMLAKAGLKEDDLRCGGHPSISGAVNDSWIKSGFSPTAMYNNCCAKHIGMLAAAKAIGVDTNDYHGAEHPIQQRIKEIVEDLSEAPTEKIFWGVDGCNAPAPALPLCAMARMYSALADATDQVKCTDCNPSTRVKRLSSIFQAMAAHPELVAGESRFCTDLGRAYDGVLVGKLGADGCYGIAIRESAMTRNIGAKGAVGIAVKVEDGRIDILYAAVVEILRQLELGSKVIWEKLSKYHSIELKNTMGVVTGTGSFDIDVRRV